MRTLALTCLFGMFICLTSQAQIRDQQTGQTGQTGRTNQTFGDRTPIRFNERISIYFSPLSGGYTSWNYNYLPQEDDPGTDETTLLRGRGWNYSPNLGVLFSIGQYGRFKVGLDAGYSFFFIDNIDQVDGLPGEAFETDNNQRQSLNVGGRVMFDLIRFADWSIMPNLGFGTFWFTRDDFNEENANRLYGHLGLMFELFPDKKVSFFAEPRYTLYNYQPGDLNFDQNSALNNFNLNLGVAIRLFHDRDQRARGGFHGR
jgi:hypothetical protein